MLDYNSDGRVCFEITVLVCKFGGDAALDFASSVEKGGFLHVGGS